MTFKDKILVIADLHLQSAEPDTLALALLFIKQARGARHLYILGDLFEYWLGDDCLFDDIPSVIAALSDLSQSGTPITLMHGNRDFLLGEKFAGEVGATLVRDDVLVLDRIVLMHGDTLCTDDVEYQQFRNQVRDANWQSTFLAKSAIERKAIATALRSGSKDASQQKTMAIMDVNAAAVDRIFNEFGCQYLVHGHTHRPAIHQHNPGTRVVVGDWHADHAMVGVVETHAGSIVGSNVGDDANVEIELLRFTMEFVTDTL